MKRRKAIRNIFYYSLGTGFLLSCKDPFAVVHNLTLKNLAFDNTHLECINDISRLILPIQNIAGLKDHTTLPFVMKSVNDLYNKEKRILFQKGYKGMDEYFTRYFAKPWKKGSLAEKKQLIIQLNNIEPKPWQEIQASKDVMKFFYDTLKKENLMYLRTTEYIQRNKRFYEMTPDRYNGSFLLADKLENLQIK